MNLKPYTPTIEEFVAAVQSGIDSFETAGRHLVSLIETHGVSILENIQSQHPHISADVLSFFERVGRKQVYYRLGLCDSPGARALERCDFSAQEKYFSQPVELLTVTGDTLLVSVHSLTADQAHQVFAKRRIRSLGEQRAYLESLKRKPQPIGKRSPYTIRAGFITFNEPCKLTVAELARILAEASS